MCGSIISRLVSLSGEALRALLPSSTSGLTFGSVNNFDGRRMDERRSLAYGAGEGYMVSDSAFAVATAERFLFAIMLLWSTPGVKGEICEAVTLVYDPLVTCTKIRRSMKKMGSGQRRERMMSSYTSKSEPARNTRHEFDAPFRFEKGAMVNFTTNTPKTFRIFRHCALAIHRVWEVVELTSRHLHYWLI